jgi:hypothetical protein
VLLDDKVDLVIEEHLNSVLIIHVYVTSCLFVDEDEDEEAEVAE